MATLALFETSASIDVVWRDRLSLAGRSDLDTSMFRFIPLSTHFDVAKFAPPGTVAAGTFPDATIGR